MEFHAGVPWMRMPGALRFIARVPRGLCGPGPMTASCIDQGDHGLYQVGMYRLSVTSYRPVGVG